MASIMHNAVGQPQTPPASSDSDPLQASLSIICDTPEDPKDSGQCDPTPGKAMCMSVEDREAAGLGSPSPQTSMEQRDSERRSKSNHDRPSRRLMLEAALVADSTVVA
jgi:hypothetical protein